MILRRIFLFTPLAVLFVLLLAVVLIRLDDYLLQKRAERMAIGFRSVLLQERGLEDAKRTFRSWGKFERDWGHDRNSRCDEADCVFAVSLSDFFWNHTGAFRKPWITRAYLLLGGRAGRVDAQVHLKNSAISDEHISVQTSGSGGPDGIYDIYVNAHGWRLGESMPLTPDQTYRIGQAANCWPCLLFDFSPKIDPGELDRLLRFDFSCLSRLGGCRNPGDLMPNAWAAFAAEQEKYCGPRRESDIRRAWDIATFDVIATGTTARGEFAKVRVNHLWKGNSSFRPGSTYHLNLSAPADAEGVRSGSKLIILFLDLFPEYDGHITPMECGTMYWNATNLNYLRDVLSGTPASEK